MNIMDAISEAHIGLVGQQTTTILTDAVSFRNMHTLIS